MTRISLVGAIVIALFIWMFPESFAHLAIGVYVEQRHILELRGIFKKACAGHPDASPAVDTRARNG